MIREYFAKTHQGPHLQLNEDNYFVDLSNLIFGACDAFGGVNIGDKACNDLINHVKSNYTKIASDPDSTMPFFYNAKFLLEANALINSIHQSHLSLIKANREQSFSKRAGVSGIFASLSNDVLTTVSLGNLIMLFCHDNKLSIHIAPEVLSPNYFGHDQESVKKGMFSLNAIGLHEDLIFQVKELKVAPGDKLYLLSDGIFPYLSFEEFNDLITIKKQKSSDLVSELFDLANQRGNHDNQTALVVEF
ncbi:SpoIIE family protein phosphatase [bacterium]|nr:SpoIIE family protein phosphatase [bacterium]